MSAKATKKLSNDTTKQKTVHVNGILNVEGIIAFDVSISGNRIVLSDNEFKIKYTKDYACYLASLARFK